MLVAVQGSGEMASPVPDTHPLTQNGRSRHRLEGSREGGPGRGGERNRHSPNTQRESPRLETTRRLAAITAVTAVDPDMVQSRLSMRPSILLHSWKQAAR